MSDDPGDGEYRLLFTPASRPTGPRPAPASIAVEGDIAVVGIIDQFTASATANDRHNEGATGVPEESR